MTPKRYWKCNFIFFKWTLCHRNCRNYSRFFKIVKNFWQVSFGAADTFKPSLNRESRFNISFLASILYFIASFPMTQLGPRPETESRGFLFENYKIVLSYRYKTVYETAVFKFSFLIDSMIFVAAWRKISFWYPYTSLARCKYCWH